MTTPPLILLAAGGTGGHLFPAEALGVELIKRGYRVRLATDSRALRYSGLFTKEMTDVVPSETVRGRNPISLARTAIMLGYGTAVAFNLVRRLTPSALSGFRAAPTVACPAASTRSRRRCPACSIAIPRYQARPPPSARRCARRSSPPPV